MFGEILFIGQENSFLDFTNLIKVFVLCKTLYCFGHSANKVIVLQSINICLPKVRNHCEVLCTKQFGKSFSAGCHQKLLEGKRV